MEYLILFIIVVILGETTFLLFKKVKPISGGRRKIYVDTSALIDGRILEIAKTGFLDGDLLILKNVLLELQLLADSKDSEKRLIARNGLELVSELERVVNVNTEVVEYENAKNKVDEELLRVAKENKGAILTLDYNLIKVAEAEKIPTLNINDLSLAVKTDFKTGEIVELKIIGKGSGKDQGIGHLKNGGMVVVQGASNRVGKTLRVELERLHETSTGRIIFGKIAKK